ncbi:MAG TPA: DUF427 domain-containing protein [Hyphomicrobiaceae bacterium]|nr:DUF427 domain-containing protein [Hyphomicrobiaceae bacterium]
MGLSWQQGPLSPGKVGRFLVPHPLPDRLLYAEPLRRRMRVRFGGEWIADSEDVLLLHQPGRYPVAYFPQDSITAGALEPIEHTTHHPDLGPTCWYAVRAGDRNKPRAAWQHTELPAHASELEARVAFAWPAMDAFYEEDERIVGHAADNYHRIDIRQTSRHLQVRSGNRVVADSTRPLVLYESGFAPRWYVPRSDIEGAALIPVEGQTFCPYKGLASYYDIGDARRAAWSYQNAWTEVARISDLVSFEPDKVTVHLDGVQLKLEPGQGVVEHGIDRDLAVEEMASRSAIAGGPESPQSRRPPSQSSGERQRRSS